MRTRSFSATTATVCCVAATITASPQVANAETEGIVKMAFFNDPLTFQTNQAGAPSEITAAILAMLAGTASAGTVDIAMYTASLGDDPTGEGDAHQIEQEIVRIVERGVHVNVVADAHKAHDLWDRVASDLAGTCCAPLFKVYYCTKSCYAGGNGIMHNKFVLVDQLAIRGVPTTDAVLQMSSNWKYAQLNSHYWNSAVEIANDSAMYNGYEQYWQALAGCGAPAGTSPTSCTGSPTGTLQGWYGAGNDFVNVLPQSSPDPVTIALDNVDHCGLTDSLNVHTTIDVAVNTWDATEVRGSDILTRLRNLNKNGCPVRIVIPATAAVASQFTGPNLGDPLDTLWLNTHCTGGRLPVGSPTEHNKYILIDGDFGDSSGQVIFTGTHRFNIDSLIHDDEVWMRLENLATTVDAQNADLYGQYETEFNQMWNATPLCAAVQVSATGTDDDDLDP